MTFAIDLNETYNNSNGVAHRSPINENRDMLPINLNVQPSNEEYIFDLNVVMSIENDYAGDVENVIGGHGLDNNIHDFFGNEANGIFRGKLVSFIEIDESILHNNQMSFLFRFFNFLKHFVPGTQDDTNNGGDEDMRCLFSEKMKIWVMH